MRTVVTMQMSRIAPTGILLCLLLALLLACGPALAAEQFDLSGGLEPFGDSSADKSLLDAIAQIESRDGAYAAELPEQMLSLGLALQQQDRHVEAIDVFKRGVHLARVNNGLYCPDQMPLLQGEITSSLALGEYARADALQKYLYRVQLRGMASGEERAAALMQQATWQFKAYQGGLEPQGLDRLVSMWDLYRLAWSDISEAAGENSPKLLPPLNGMLRTQYLVSEYRPESAEPAYGFNAASNAEANRYYTNRSQAYELGKAVILSIYKIQASDKGEASNEAVEALVALGDWDLWNDKREQAVETYQLALAELAGRDDAQQVEQQLFGTPRPLPDLQEISRLPPAVGADQGNILVEFGVDSRGETVDLERLDANENMDAAAGRLMRKLRKTRFRPRFEDGQPAETNKLVRAYDIKP